MGAPVSTTAALAGAKQALKNADNFGQRETGNKKAGDRPSYSAARSARAESGAAPKPTAAAPKEFMGIRSDESNELNTALASRAQAREALK